MPRRDLLQLRRGTAALWASVNPTLAAGEPGYETDTGQIKYGPGAWNSLAYSAGGGGGSTAWLDITGKPTTLAGYGIVDAAALAHTHTFASLTSTPTTLAGYGIADAAPLVHTHAFADLTAKPTTLAGYGIVDAAAAAHTHAFSSLTGIPTTLAGYGISDAYPLAGNPSAFLTANQLITLTGDVSGSGTVAITTVIGAGVVTNAMLAGSIAYSKLSLTGTILNADLAGSIAYSKLSLTGAILNADLAGSIALSKLSITGTPDGTKFLRDDGSWQAAAGGGPSAADPTGTIGLSVVNGAAATFLRSDGAPALSQAIAPTWTAAHIWSLSSAAAIVVGPNGATNPTFSIVTNVASAATGISVIGRAAAAGVTIAAISSGSNESILLAPKGTGAVSVSSNIIAATDNTHTIGVMSDGTTLRRFFGNFTGIYVDRVGIPVAAQIMINSGANAIQIGTGATVGVRFGANIGVTWASNPEAVAPDVGMFRAAAGTVRVTNVSTGAGNLLLGTSAGAIGTSGAGVLAWCLSTAPSTSPTDTVQAYSADWNGAGTAALHIRNEEGHIIKLARQTVTGAHGSNAALQDLLTKLANIGLIVDGSS